MAELTDCERVIMQALWRNGAMTAQAIEQATSNRFANSTVRTFLRILERKGHVAHRKKSRSFVYEPLTTRQQATREAFRSMLDRFFDGSTDSLRAWLAGREASPDQNALSRPETDQKRPRRQTQNTLRRRTALPPRRASRRGKAPEPVPAQIEQPSKSPTEQDVWLL
jgi:predicted transcriptional regulator